VWPEDWEDYFDEDELYDEKRRNMKINLITEILIYLGFGIWIAVLFWMYSNQYSKNVKKFYNNNKEEID
jgi:hypothetical protein